MSDAPKTLPVPEAVLTEAAHELIRVWNIGGRQQVSISRDLGGDPAQFGQLLAQIALHSAGVYESNEDIARADSLRQILTGFKSEIEREVTGR